MSLFVVGTDTDVGKTVVSAVLLARYGPRCRLAYWKPVATGGADGRDTDAVARLAGRLAHVHEEGHLFGPPVSPHLAARRAGRRIDPERLIDRLFTLRRDDPECHLVVEGIGGVLVPLDDEGYLLADLVRASRLACVVVARSTLGTINHTLLTLEALRRRRVPVAGVVLNGPANPPNREAVQRFGKVDVIAQLSPLAPLNAETVARAARTFDRRARLQEWFGA